MEIAVTVVSAICLVYLLTLLTVTVYKFFACGREERYEFLKKFKKGSCFLVYFASIPLYFIAMSFNGKAWTSAIASSIANGVELIVLKVDWAVLAPLMQASLPFKLTMAFCYGLVIANSFLFVFAVKGMDMINAVSFKRALKQKDVYIVIGFNKESKQIVRSISNKKKIAILFADKESYSDKEAVRKFTYDYKASCKPYAVQSLKALLKKSVGKYLRQKPINIIINTGDDNQNLLLTKELSEFITENDRLEARGAISRNGIEGYVFCQPDNISSFVRFVEQSHGCIQYINKYKITAIDFVSKYPLSQCLKNNIHGELPVVKPEIQLNMVLVGFGKLARQLFMTSASTEQFVTLDGDDIVEKPVRYCVYDNKTGATEKNLNHNYLRFSQFKKEKNASDYLPYAKMPAELVFHKTDINDQNFYESIRADIGGENNYSYIIVGFGDDLVNLDLAEKLTVKIREWGYKNVQVFARIKSKDLTQNVTSNQSIIFFGNEEDTVYDIDKIIMERFETMAKQRHLSYTKEGRENLAQDKIHAIARSKWYQENGQVQRDSNIYACLSVRSKLNLLGYDCVIGDFDDSQAVKEFMHAYERGDEIAYGSASVDGRKFIKYKNEDFDKLSARKTYAVIEHKRWNANHICWGFVPASKAEIFNDKEKHGKDFSIRRHGCLTTFNGLKEYAKIVSESTGDSLEQTDVIRYDYQIMDEAIWLLHANGYRLRKL